MPSAGAIKKVEGLNPYQKLLLAVFGTKTKPELPKLGDRAQARDIGRKENARYIWTACPRCHKERWVLIYNLKYSKYNGLCINCWIHRNRLNGSWIRRSHGCIKLKLQPDDFFYPMADKEGYVLEHRLVMAKHLGRCLHSWEVVRHQNDVRKDDNRIEVLELMTDERNIQIMVMERRIKRLEERIILLEGENVLLGVQLNKVTER